MSPARSFVGLLAAALLLVGFAPPAHAAVDGPCATPDGVTVIVDSTALGGSITQRCAAGAQQSGLVALGNAGFVMTPVSNQSALVCRIDNLPAPDRESCLGAPPTNAYWAYFRANRGGPWLYSNVGAQTPPPPGAVEGWVFFDRAQKVPGIAAPPAFTPTPTPTPTQTTPGASSPTPTKSPRPTASPTSKKPIEPQGPASAGAGGIAATPQPQPPSPAQVGQTVTPGQQRAVKSTGAGSASASAAALDGYGNSLTGETVAAGATPAGGSVWSSAFGLVILGGLLIATLVLELRRRRNMNRL